MALSSPESPVPPRRVVINRTENPSEEHEELNMARGVVAESRRFVLLVGFSSMRPFQWGLPCLWNAVCIKNTSYHM